VPSWRATKDVSIKEDLVEEIGRMVGYSSITPTPPSTPARVPPANPRRIFHNRVRDTAAAQGFTEVYNYSFVNEEMARELSLDLNAHAHVANPIAADQNLLRTSLLPGILRNVRDNARHFDRFRLFEIGHEVHTETEVPHFAAALFDKENGLAALLELKRLAECLLPGAVARPAAARPFEHPQRAADVVAGGSAVGRLFEFHPTLVEHGRAAVLDLDLELLERAQPAVKRYQPSRRFPSSSFDLSVVAHARALIGDVQAALGRLGGQALVELEFLREFVLPTGERSLSYRLTLCAEDRTLSAQEVGAARSAIIEGMRAAGYDLRV
jgi:phenylalanyl-tRNA synthetase beta chain